MMKILRMFTSVFGAGRSPLMPGTVGSLVTVFLVWLLRDPIGLSFGWELLLLGAAILFGTWSSHRVARAMEMEDPQEIVIDELAGQWIALLLIPENWPWWLAGFVLFRLFDIWKPWLIDRVQHLPGGGGIMADDVLAGALAFSILQLARLAL